MAPSSCIGSPTATNCFTISAPLSILWFFFLLVRPPPASTLFPYTTLFRSRLEPPLSLPPECCTGRPRSILERSEEHTSEFQSHSDLVCRLLLEKKKTDTVIAMIAMADIKQQRLSRILTLADVHVIHESDLS